MERFILKKLLDWKDSPYRKPLILKGVRQVGKTWILKEFGRLCYENTAYFNFDENEEYDFCQRWRRGIRDKRATLRAHQCALSSCTQVQTLYS